MASAQPAARRVVLRGVSFSYSESRALLEQVDLSFGMGWTALVGANGSGKTTLLRLIAGELVPSEGSIERPDDIQVLAQSIERAVDRTLADREDSAAHRLRSELALVPGDLERWPTLSPGERRRWQIGSALARAPELLLLDEPTNHLDADGRALLIRALRSFRGSGIVVSHDRTLLEQITTTTVRVERGRARAWSGPYSEARAAWEAEARAQLAERERRKAQLDKAACALDRARREHASTERSRSTKQRMRNRHDSDARASGANARAMRAEAVAGQAVARRSAASSRAAEDLKQSERVPRERGRPLFLDFVPASRRAVFCLDAPSIEVGGRPLLHDVRLTLGRKDRIRLSGPNGAGKTTLLAALLAQTDDPRVLFVPQHIRAESTARAIEALLALPSERKGHALSLIAALGADAARIVAAASPSAGEARQLAIAAGLTARAHTVVLDEPTNDLDLPAIERLEEALAEFPGALLVVTHDDALAARLNLSEWCIEEGSVRVR